MPHSARIRRRVRSSGFADLFGTEFLATHGLVIFCLVVFAFAVALDKNLPVFPERDWGKQFRVSTLLRLGFIHGAVLPAEPWRLLSAVFLHFNVLHLGLNLWGLVSLGRSIEARFGAARALLVFLAAGVGGFVASTWWYGATQMTCGASGGVFGQLGAVMGILVARRLPGWKDMLWQNLAYAVLMGFVFRVNTAAHLGGFVIGFALGYGLDKQRIRPAITRVFMVLAVLGALASVVSVLLCMRSPYASIAREQELRYED